MNKTTNRIILACLLFSSAFLATQLHALPEDETVEISVSAGGPGGFSIDSGVRTITYTGTIEEPVIVTKGSLIIKGLKVEIGVEQENGTLQSITTTGSKTFLAHFQQQLKQDQDIVFIDGENIHFDNNQQILTIDGSGQFRQGDTHFNSCHIDFNLENESGNFIPCEGDARVEMSISSEASSGNSSSDNQ